MTWSPTSMVGLEFDGARHLYRLDGRLEPSVTQVLVEEGFVDPTFFTEEGRWRGSQVHEITRLYDENDLDDFDPDFQGYLDAWKRCRKELKAAPVSIELPVASRIYGFTGTLDRIMVSRLWRRPMLWDLKSGPFDLTTTLQTAGYEIAYRESVPRPGNVERGSVHLHEDGTYDFKIHDDPMDGNVFLCALSSLKWKRRHRKEISWK